MTSQDNTPARNKLAVALVAVRAAMREHRKGKPVAFQVQGRAVPRDC